MMFKYKEDYQFFSWEKKSVFKINSHFEIEM